MRRELCLLCKRSMPFVMPSTSKEVLTCTVLNKLNACTGAMVQTCKFNEEGMCDHFEEKLWATEARIENKGW